MVCLVWLTTTGLLEGLSEALGREPEARGPWTPCKAGTIQDAAWENISKSALPSCFLANLKVLIPPGVSHFTPQPQKVFPATHIWALPPITCHPRTMPFHQEHQFFPEV